MHIPDNNTSSPPAASESCDIAHSTLFAAHCSVRYCARVGCCAFRAVCGKKRKRKRKRKWTVGSRVEHREHRELRVEC
eukprot:675874-Rhodomonas_salina.1